MKKNEIKYIIAQKSSSFSDEIQECILLLNDLMKDKNYSGKNIPKIVVFIKASSDNDYNEKKEIILAKLLMYFEDNCPPAAVVSETPYKRNIAIELRLSSDEFRQNSINGIKYSKLEDNTKKEIYAAGITSYVHSDNISVGAKSEFEMIDDILKHEDIFFSDIIRQWNYIADIVKIWQKEEPHSQNYQEFNNIRTEFYSKSVWINGYPAATGIGMGNGKIIIDFFAAKYKDNTKIFALKNPNQIDAHSYSEDVLVCNENNQNYDKTTPKFERGKIVFKENNFNIHVSGTAAIHGETTIAGSNVIQQTLTTIENITKVISIENIKENCPIDFSERIIKGFGMNHASYFRIYVKNEFDIPAVKEVCDYYLCGVPIIYLQADICRRDLLVEIEGSFFDLDYR